MSALPLAGVTLGRYLTARAALGLTGASDECDLSAVPPRAFAEFVGVVCVARPGERVEVDAADVYARWRAATEAAYSRGLARAKEVSRHNGFSGTGSGFGDPAPPEAIVGHLTLSEMVAAWDLPLWAVAMHGPASASVAAEARYFENLSRTN